MFQIKSFLSLLFAFMFIFSVIGLAIGLVWAAGYIGGTRIAFWTMMFLLIAGNAWEISLLKKSG
ncbi:MAG: hypothetical protein WCT41_02705 [Candidatus Paceibacterota bacterium]